MYLTALAYREFDEQKWKTMCQNVVNFNEPDFELAFVRFKARQQLENS